MWTTFLVVIVNMMAFFSPLSILFFLSVCVSVYVSLHISVQLFYKTNKAILRRFYSQMPSSIASAALTPTCQVRQLCHSLKYVLLDIDGVLWSGDNPIRGASEAVQHFRSKGLEVRFLSNNASVSRKQLAARLIQRGIAGVKLEEVYNSGRAAALQLLQRLGRPHRSVEGAEMKVHGNVLVVGEEGLHDEIQSVLGDGFITYGLELHHPDALGGYQAPLVAKAWREAVLPPPKKMLRVKEKEFQADSPTSERISLMDLRPVAVVAGLDLHFNPLSIATASMALRGPPPDLLHDFQAALEAQREHSQTLFIATNEDPQIPVGADKALLPGAGVMIAALTTVSGRRPDAVCGKPFTDMAEALLKAEGISERVKDSFLMVGDRLTTDVAFGNAAGMSTMFVLSGAETLEDVNNAQKAGRTELLPTYIANSLADFLPS